MKIALIGYGKMGKMVEQQAEKEHCPIVARITSADADWSKVAEADVCIDFTQPGCVVENLTKMAPHTKNIVIGTTGWYEQSLVVAALVARYKLGVIYSPNFSLGINILLLITRYAAKLLNNFPEYDAGGIEAHHRNKLDAPSGTALALGSAVADNIDRIERLPWASLRCGAIPGSHKILFDSPVDTITISHEARSREGFALGALRAASWLLGRQGLFTFEDFLQSITKELRR